MQKTLLIPFILTFFASNLLAGPAADSPGFKAAREKLIRDTIEGRGISDPPVLAAMREVTRHNFIPANIISKAYPSFKLQGILGYESLALSGLISQASFAAGVLSGISWPIFQGGAIRNNIKVQTALQEQALLDYETAICQAVEEVENALYAMAREHERIKDLEVATRSAEEAANVALQHYEAGMVEYQNVLETQRSLTNFQDQLAQSRGTETLDLIAVYKALGGGWTSIDHEG